MIKKLIFIAIILLGIFFRLYQLNSLPGGLFLDEINMAVDAKTLAQNGVDQYGRTFPFYFEDATDFKLPGYIYAATASYKLFGNTILAMHVPSALAGIVSIFLIGYLATLLFPEKKYIGYFAAATLALSPFAIHFSRISYETNVALCMTILYLIALFHVLKNTHTKRWLFIGSIAILIADLIYPSPRFVIPVFTFLLLSVCYVFRIPEATNLSSGRQGKNIFLSLIFLGVVAITYIPTIIFPFADTRQLNLIVVDTAGQTFLQSLLLKANSVFVSSIREWNLEFLFDKGDIFAYRHGTKEIGVFLLVFVIPFLLGIWWSVQRIAKKNFPLVFLFLFTLITELPSALSSETPYGTRILVMLIPYAIFIALGIDVSFTWAAQQKDYIQKIIYAVLGLIVLYQVGLFSYIYFVDFRHTSLPEFPNAPVEIASYIKNFHQKNPQTQIYFMAEKSCRVWSNDALYLWYYDNLPNKEMIAWNNAYRIARYAHTSSSPFDAYDQVRIPSAFIPSFNMYLYSGYETQAKAPQGSLFVRCGDILTTYNKNTEKLVKVVYMDDTTKQDPYYVVTVKK